MAEGESLAANVLSFKVIDFIWFKNGHGSNPAQESEHWRDFASTWELKSQSSGNVPPAAAR